MARVFLLDHDSLEREARLPVILSEGSGEERRERIAGILSDHYEHVANVACEDLDEVYALGQNVEASWTDNDARVTWAKRTSLRSISIGDVIELDDGRIFAVDLNDFLHINTKTRSEVAELIATTILELESARLGIEGGEPAEGELARADNMIDALQALAPFTKCNAVGTLRRRAEALRAYRRCEARIAMALIDELYVTVRTLRDQLPELARAIREAFAEVAR